MACALVTHSKMPRLQIFFPVACSAPLFLTTWAASVLTSIPRMQSDKHMQIHQFDNQSFSQQKFQYPDMAKWKEQQSREREV